MGRQNQKDFAQLSAEIIIALEEVEQEIDSVPEEGRFGLLKEKLAPYPVHIQGAVIMAYRLGRAQYMENREVRKEKERRLGFLWGVGFIVLLILIALFVPNPSPWQYTIFRIVLALAAAGFTNYIEGMLEVKSKIVRGTGPLAVFFIVYYFSPAALEFFEVTPG